MELNTFAHNVWMTIQSSVLDPVLRFASEYWRHGNKTVLLVLLALGVGYRFGRKRYVIRGISRSASFQNYGEAIVARTILQNFVAPNYHLMNHITLQMSDGTTQIDHILISRFGIFVIETKHFGGWLFANPQRAKWTQVLFGQKNQFQNPILQNVRHARAVADALDFLPDGVIKPVVVFTGDAEFRTEMPSGVFSLSGLIDHIHNQTKEVISINRMQFCVGRLETTRLAITGETDVKHVEEVRQKLGNLHDLT